MHFGIKVKGKTDPHIKASMEEGALHILHEYSFEEQELSYHCSCFMRNMNVGRSFHLINSSNSIVEFSYILMWFYPFPFIISLYYPIYCSWVQSKTRCSLGFEIWCWKAWFGQLNDSERKFKTPYLEEAPPISTDKSMVKVFRVHRNPLWILRRAQHSLLLYLRYRYALLY